MGRSSVARGLQPRVVAHPVIDKGCFDRPPNDAIMPEAIENDIVATPTETSTLTLTATPTTMLTMTLSLNVIKIRPPWSLVALPSYKQRRICDKFLSG